MAIANHFLMSTLGLAKSSRSDRPYEMNRYMGGHQRKTQPYVSGYWYFMLLTPDAIFNNGNLNAGNVGAEGGLVNDLTEQSTDNNQATGEQWFHSTAESFTPPNTNLTKIDIPGMGGLGSSFIGGREITRTFTVAFREYTGLPIMTLLRKWNSILDPYLGVGSFKADMWMPNSYKGVACAFLCKPTVSESEQTQISADDLEQMYFFDGVWPESQPDDSFNTDIASNEALQLSVTFSFDGSAYNKEAFGSKAGAAAIKIFNQRYGLDEIIEHINKRVFVGETLLSSGAEELGAGGLGGG
jgi:hypothetical protein